MIVGLGSALGFTPSSFPKQIQSILLRDQVEADASPLVHDMCTMYMKAGLPVVFVSFKHSYEVLVGLYRRLGYDLNMLEAQGLYKYIDGSRYLLGIKDLNSLNDEISNDGSRGLVVLDEVSLFESINPDFCGLVELINPIQSYSSHDTLIRCTTGVESPLSRWLMHRSTFVLESRPLSSGLSREFHAELSCRHGGKSYSFPRIPSTPFLVRYTESSVFLGLKGSQLA